MRKLKIRLLLIVVCLTIFGEIAKAQDSNDVIKIDTALVNIPVIVSDRNGRNIPGLKVENFNVFQDGKQQKIEYFVSEETPINVAILLDTSRSTQSVLGKIRSAAKDFIKQLLPNDRALIVTFDNDVEVLSELTSDKKSLEKAIKNAEIGDRVGTVLHDAVFEVVNKHFAKVSGRKAMILLTDGEDFGSSIYEAELIRQTEESDTLIYSIYYEIEQSQFQSRQDPNPFPRRNNRFPNQRRFPDNFPPRQQRTANTRRTQNIERSKRQAIEFLQKLSDSTAGRLYEKDASDLKQTFTLISDELRKQYVIGYYPEKTEEGKLHQIRVRTDLQNAVVRSKTVFRSQKTQ